ncbi:MAG: FtsX-like permease family protein [Gemmatimonadota bacterium]
MSVHVSILTRLALRNLRRQTRRSLLSGLAMVVGLALLAFSRALAAGAHEDWIEAGVRLSGGHVTVEAPHFHARKTLSYRISGDELRAVNDALSTAGLAADVRSSAVRLEIQGLASTAVSAAPVTVLGVQPGSERDFSHLAERLINGRYLAENDRLHAYIGEKLAERLGLGIDSRLILTAQDAEGEISGQLTRVAGIFRTGIPEVDERRVEIPIGMAREWLGADGSATSVALLLGSSDRVQDVVARLDHELSSRDADLEVLTWREASPGLDAAIRMDDFGDWVFHSITLVVVALAVVNTILMSVLYRVREFGVVRALGLTRTETGVQVLIEGLLLSVASGLLGIALGLALTWIFFRDGLDYSFLLEEGFRAAGTIMEPIVRPRFHVSQLIGSLAFVFGIGILASAYPAFRATRIEVADAMKFEA